MRKENQKKLIVTMCWLAAFVIWTIAIKVVDLQEIGPNDSTVGFATFNKFFHELTGVHMLIYTITDWLGLVPICFVLGFAGLGLIQLIKRRSFIKVDSDILVLGGFYIIVMAAYVLFEMVAVNYRPVLIEGVLEASYPSSTTLLTMCVMPTAIMQLCSRVKSDVARKIISYSIAAFTVFMVGGRLISGVHWFTDIVGGALLSVGLVMMYKTVKDAV